MFRFISATLLVALSSGAPQGFNLGSLFGQPQPQVQPQAVQQPVFHQPQPQVAHPQVAHQPVFHQPQPQFVQPHPATVQAHPHAVQPHPATVQAHPHAIQPHPATVQAHPHAVQAHPAAVHQPVVHHPQPVHHQPTRQQPKSNGFLPSVDHSQPQNLLAFAGFAGAAGLAIHNANSGNGEVSIRPNVGLAIDPKTGALVPSVTAGVQVGKGTGSSTFNVGGAFHEGELAPVVGSSINVVDAADGNITPAVSSGFVIKDGEANGIVGANVGLTQGLGVGTAPTFQSLFGGRKRRSIHF